MSSKLQRMAMERYRQSAAVQRSTNQPQSQSSNSVEKHGENSKATSFPTGRQGKELKAATGLSTDKQSASMGKKENAGASSSNSALKKKVGLLGVHAKHLGKDELNKLKMEAVIREREKRRKKRLEEEAKEKDLIKKSKEEAVRREKSRSNSISSVSSLSKQDHKEVVKKALERKNSVSANDLKQFKEAAIEREIKKERLRRKSLMLQKQTGNGSEAAPTKQQAELQQYKQAAIERAALRQRRLDKTLKMASKQLIGTVEELRMLFFQKAGEQGLLSKVEAEKLVLQMTTFKLHDMKGLKFISWATLVEHLVEPPPPPPPPPTRAFVHADSAKPNKITTKSVSSKKVLEQKLKSVLSLCHASFAKLEQFSDTDEGVRPSDLNAVLGNYFEGGSQDIRMIHGGIALPPYPENGDEPITWKQYSNWLTGYFEKQNGEILGDSWDRRNVLPQESSNNMTKPQKKNKPKQQEQAENSAKQEAWTSPKPPKQKTIPAIATSIHSPPTPQEVEIVSQKIANLEDQLEKLKKNKQSDSDLSSSDEDDDSVHGNNSSEIEEEDDDDDYDYNIAKQTHDDEEEDDEDDKVLYAGRCWLLCERKNDDWLSISPRRAKREEWIQGREVCAEIEVTQVRDPFRLYISAQLLRNGLGCMRRVSVEELTQMTAFYAQQQEQERISLSKSGRHVVLKRGEERFQYKSLGPEEWTRSELEAAIKAEEAMKTWVKRGKIPKQNDLVKWILLHSKLRIADEHDLDGGHVHLVLPGEDVQENIEEEEEEEEMEQDTNDFGRRTKRRQGGKTALGIGNRYRLNRVGSPLSRGSRTPKRKVDDNHDVAVPKMMQGILDKQDHRVIEVEDWLFLERKELIRLFENLMAPSLTKKDLQRFFRQFSSTTDALSKLLDHDKLIHSWKRKSKGLRVADIYDLFRNHEDNDRQGQVSLSTFVAINNDTLMLDIPEWQLVVYHKKFSFYRDWVKFLYQSIME